MPNMELQSELISLQAHIAQAEALTASARSQAGIPVPPNGPAIGLTTMAEAVDAQNKVLKKIHKLLEKMV